MLYGVYSYREAARLLQVSWQRVARWAEGYLFEVKYGYRFSAPVLQSSEHRRGVLSFGEDILRRPDIGQLVADFAESLVRHVELEADEVSRYYPPTFEREVLLDRQIRAGEPVVWESDYAIPTRVIYDLWETEKDVDSVADYFSIPPHKVSVAIRYESEWRLVA